MKDWWNPTIDEIRVWAYDKNPNYTEQDFELAVADIKFKDLILELANDDNCPNQKFFLSCAYLLIGDYVRVKYPSTTKGEIEDFLQQIKTYKNNKSFQLLYQRAIKLIKEPSSFNYELWCGGGYTYQDNKT